MISHEIYLHRATGTTKTYPLLDTKNLDPIAVDTQKISLFNSKTKTKDGKFNIVVETNPLDYDSTYKSAGCHEFDLISTVNMTRQDANLAMQLYRTYRTTKTKDIPEFQQFLEYIDTKPVAIKLGDYSYSMLKPYSPTKRKNPLSLNCREGCFVAMAFIDDQVVIHTKVGGVYTSIKLVVDMDKEVLVNVIREISMSEFADIKYSH